MKIINAILFQFIIIDPIWWIAIGIIAALLLLFRHRLDQQVGNILTIYVLTILATTVLSRQQIKDYSFVQLINLDLAGTWIKRINSGFALKSELLLNFCMLLPFGLLFPWATKRGFLPTALFGFALIMLIELSQLITRRGWFELSDIVDNTIGVMIGYALYRIWNVAWRKLKC